MNRVNPQQVRVVIDAGGRSLAAQVADVGQNGMLALFDEADLDEGDFVHVQLTHPSSGASVDFDGRVANRTRCEGGVMAVRVEFRYAFDRVEEVTGFIDDLHEFQCELELGGMSGSLTETRLEAVLETFSGISSSGTFLIRRGNDEGKIAYADGEILDATTGLVAGAKALGRMFTWRDAHFEFQPGVEPLSPPPTPMPFDSAVLMAAFQRDEVARLDLSGIDGEATFDQDDERFQQLKGELDEIQLEFADYASTGFALAAILDVITATDAAIYKGLAGLVESGILSVR